MMRNFCISVLIAGCMWGCSTPQAVVASYDLPTTWPADTFEYVEIAEDEIVVTAPEYQATATLETDLIHTKIAVSFDWEKEYCFGKAWITAKPWFYPSDSVVLDAKGFTIHQVELVTAKGNQPLRYRYDSLQLFIQLDKMYGRKETFTIYIDYTAKPAELKSIGSDAITEDRGLYFVNKDGKDPYKPRQLWTQGETEANSCWFPTIDKPNQKMTFEISITAEKDQVTLSNGIMTSTKKNSDGTHTDTWKLDQPFSPYLVMMAVGPFRVVKDRWKAMEVNYYVDKEYEPHARKIFGNTPEMIEYFSDVLDFPYPWPKYSQVVVHDFVTGAMENVTATTHGSFVQMTSRELIDGHPEDVIAHELFHQWFGDLVSTESWANITLNESFATYGEYLWNEYKYGKEEADFGLSRDRNAYLNSGNAAGKPLVRYYYESQEEVFDVVSYQKGGAILHMLRNHVGDEAFFSALNLYLKTHMHTGAEVDDLRLAFEKVTGKDLHWFFDQWYFKPGHPKLDVSYEYDEALKEIRLAVDQSPAHEESPVYRLPVAIDIYSGNTVERREMVVEGKSFRTSFPCTARPDLVNFDAAKMLLAKKTVKQPEEAWAFQYRNGRNVMDRYEALQYFVKKASSPFYHGILAEAMVDSFHSIRQLAVGSVSSGTLASNDTLLSRVKKLAAGDPKSSVRAAALRKVHASDSADRDRYVEEALNDSSYLVITTALELILESDTQKAYRLAQSFEKESSEDIRSSLMTIYTAAGDASKNPYLIQALKQGGNFFKYQTLDYYGEYLSQMLDQPQVLSEGLAYVEELAANSSSWYVRYKATFALDAVLASIEGEQEVLKERLAQMDVSGPSFATLQEQQAALTITREDLARKIAEIKTAETDERLVGLYNR